MSPYPKVVTLGIEWVIFSGSLDKDKWGKGHGARPKIADNIHRVSDTEIQDRTRTPPIPYLCYPIPPLSHRDFGKRPWFAGKLRPLSHTLCYPISHTHSGQNPIL
ncbi:hypothetical protein CYLTODRAFT_416538 [Cylindrobasidium torrendii FP15055 ss-10]|uniref:Uncharacterized protein n=1 Tax=Cylindrobasidium torrendii FP15055 ss-10 TaxID=1314674 RepID=A0A0D7BU00_9AGAR|nr:hypothetical protein CYLTODRAFT_416538 [Cylindrobasidium torrendii FP15055 ss-10]